MDEIVYIVTEGEYSDYHIDSIFSDKNKADIHAALIRGNVEEWPVDAITIDCNQKIIKYAVVRYSLHFKSNPIRSISFETGIEGNVDFSNSINFKKDDYNKLNIRADTEEKAKKIFYDKYSEAMNEYLIELKNTIDDIKENIKED